MNADYSSDMHFFWCPTCGASLLVEPTISRQEYIVICSAGGGIAGSRMVYLTGSGWCNAQRLAVTGDRE